MKTKHFLILILAVMALSFFAGHMVTWKKRNASYTHVLALTDSISHYEVAIGDFEEQVWEKDQLIGTQEQAIEAGILEIDRLKALKMKYITQITKLEGQLRAAVDNIPLPDTLFVTDTVEVGSGEGKTYLKIPFSTGYNDEYIGLDFGVKENKTWWWDLDAKVPLTITLGGKKGKSVASVTTPSPFVRITDFNVVQIQEENWYYRNPWIPYAVGGAGGFIAGWALFGR